MRLGGRSIVKRGSTCTGCLQPIRLGKVYVTTVDGKDARLCVICRRKRDKAIAERKEASYQKDVARRKKGGTDPLG